LGIIFGVGSVIAMLAISQGAKKESLAQIEAMGIDNIIVSTKQPSITDKKDSSSAQNSVIKSYGLTCEDYDHILQMDNVERITSVRDSRKIIMSGTKRVDAKLVSVDFDFLKDSRSEIVKGRWLTSLDESTMATVCVIGRNVRKKLFPITQSKILGEIIKVQNAALKVVGILENNYGTRIAELGSPNNMIFIPVETSNALFTYNAFQREGRAQLKISQVQFDIFIVKVKELQYIDHTAKRISGYLEKRHEKGKDWSLFIPLELLKQKEKTQNIFTIVMGSIAGISLIVGGVGIMNIMLANVYERRKEIGTRRALGAKKSEILLQFIFETVFLTSIGGGCGIVLGIGISKTITYYAGWPVVFSSWIILLSFIISGMVGIAFGTYPAWKAAQQNPIDVLRAE
jgi:putative ABC transport system permease protein